MKSDYLKKILYAGMGGIYPDYPYNKTAKDHLHTDVQIQQPIHNRLPFLISFREGINEINDINDLDNLFDPGFENMDEEGPEAYLPSESEQSLKPQKTNIRKDVYRATPSTTYPEDDMEGVPLPLQKNPGNNLQAVTGLNDLKINAYGTKRAETGKDKSTEKEEYKRNEYKINTQAQTISNGLDSQRPGVPGVKKTSTAENKRIPNIEFIADETRQSTQDRQTGSRPSNASMASIGNETSPSQEPNLTGIPNIKDLKNLQGIHINKGQDTERKDLPDAEVFNSFNSGDAFNKVPTPIIKKEKVQAQKSDPKSILENLESEELQTYKRMQTPKSSSQFIVENLQPEESKLQKTLDSPKHKYLYTPGPGSPSEEKAPSLDGPKRHAISITVNKQDTTNKQDTNPFNPKKREITQYPEQKMKGLSDILHQGKGARSKAFVNAPHNVIQHRTMQQNPDTLFFINSQKRNETRIEKITKDIASISRKLDEHIKNGQQKAAKPSFLPKRPASKNLGGWSTLERLYIR